MSETHRTGWEKPLNPSLYAPDEEEKAFMQATTGIQDDEELKAHIIAVQTKAFELYKYPCIRQFDFMRLKMARLPAYSQFTELGKRREGAIFLDMGCCCISVGNDIRKAVLDGWPIEGAIAADLSEELWNAGHELFRSTPETFPVPFFRGDILDPAFLASAPVLPTCRTPPATNTLSLPEMNTLTQLQGRIAAVHASSFFHLFKFDAQEQVARRLAGLLSPIPGSMLFGTHGGLAVKGRWCPDEGTKMDCHSPESWEELWVGIFSEVDAEIDVKATMREHIGGLTVFGTYPGNAEQRYWLDWSVTRV
ncbi:hypothetical protein BD311DRAFT_719492 [Dichomitus squalens]|uniref:Methyltransferase domain-containing protein n=1 Tax=Dichomitus squalens TaxID=114155 RepID=A0A4Q9MRU4_9APHY|nr:hypothetical protein BD311DRAFT_719492 [Dichomitus squalens]